MAQPLQATANAANTAFCIVPAASGKTRRQKDHNPNRFVLSSVQKCSGPMMSEWGHCHQLDSPLQGDTLTKGHIMQFTADRSFADADKAARKLMDLANAVEPYMDRRVSIELINAPSDQRNQAANISHRSKASPDSTSLASRIEFPTMTSCSTQISVRQIANR